MWPSFARIGFFLLFVCTDGYLTPDGRTLDRIVGGHDTNVEDVPYMLSFRLEGRHACGAAVLTKEWGVTAAHCVVAALPGNPYREITILSGTTYYNYKGTVHNVTDVFWHEEYNPDDNNNDIALFKVSPPFRFGKKTQPLYLPSDSSKPPEDIAVVSGWGTMNDYSEQLSLHLQYVVIPKIDKETCRAEYKNREYTVTDSQVCYGYQQGKEDSCQGDSGGPLVDRDFVLIGITSWGDGCAEEFSPGVYTDAVYLSDWIKNKISPYNDKYKVPNKTLKRFAKMFY
ncbi:trypsin-7-like [Prorops nasuta]|uniref:trypsin-7-like n=1 Tax=Prorops nasuta TaxID=863751 RepID=UPI0034CD6DF2